MRPPIPIAVLGIGQAGPETAGDPVGAGAGARGYDPKHIVHGRRLQVRGPSRCDEAD